MTAVVAELELVDLPGLYPLTVRVDVPSPEGVFLERTFERYLSGRVRLELPKPRSLDRYDFVELRVRANRVVAAPGSAFPISMRKPTIQLR
jgi:hypothetical protein